MNSPRHPYDVVLLYAPEDEEYASRLATGLRAAGFGVWFDSFEVRVGDSIVEKANEGLSTAKRGLVVISDAFLKRSPQGLAALFQMEKPVLPVWHKATEDVIRSRYPMLLDLHGVSSDAELDEVVRKLAEAMLDDFPGLVAVVPSHADPPCRFLRGEGELIIAGNGAALTLWELLLQGRDEWYPIWIGGRLYDREDLLGHALNSLSAARDQAALAVGNAGVDALRNELREWSGTDPFELG